MFPAAPHARPYWLLLAAGCMSGCMRVGPDFQPQHENWADHWSSASIEQATQQATQPDSRQWWQIFADRNLESLIEQADANNGDVKIAGLRVLEARAQLGIALAGRYPQVQQASADVLASARKRSDGFNPRSGQRFPVIVEFDAGERARLQNVRVGGQAEVMAFPDPGNPLNPLGRLFLRLMSWVSYLC